MKTQIFKNSKYFLLMILFSGSVLTMSGQPAEKKISREYSVSEGFTLGIDNKYGEINIVNWEQDRVTVDITITVEARSESKAEELLKQIEIDISESKSEVYFDTEVEKINAGGKTTINIKYDVKAPAYINAMLEQSYGEVYIQELTGTAELEIRYGSLRATSLVNREQNSWNTLDLKYGNATIENVSALSAEVMYSELTVNTSQVLETESAYSKLFFGTVSELSAECKYDKLNVDLLEGILEVDGAYTNVSVVTISQGFSQVFIDLAYGNFKAGLESQAAFAIEAEVSFGSIRIPDGDYEMEKEATNQAVRGTIGGKSAAKILADIKYGNLVLE
ncbi:MAG: hypothetical protein P1P82_08380 [Bacteroidales bacterium]|nr:hypothetical protein [Bacteroidales bacterium]MDT8432306.1 hypothetical protein [Bacteroidales bacterium]